MQNNVTELTQKLLRSLDSNYNVIDMPAVIEIISLLEKVSITKELLETTRLGKYVNQLRRNTSNESLAKRAKELVKKWRDMVLPDSNGQLKAAEPAPEEAKKRPAKEPPDGAAVAKRPRLNGQMSELEFSDNSNSSFKDVVAASKKSVIVINSDSNSSVPDSKEPDPQPKKRGRKKGSKNHKDLLEEAETSFSNKLNVSRGNAKVKTTQELLADLHIKSSINSKPIEDLNERAAKLTERVSIIDQKLNANSRFRNSHKKLRNSEVKSEVIESGIVTNVKVESTNSSPSFRDKNSFTDDEIIVVDDNDEKVEAEAPFEPPPNVPKSLSVEEALALLPPVDPSVLEQTDPEPHCSCQLIENKTDFSVEDDEEEVNVQHTFEFLEDSDCLAKGYLEEKYHLDSRDLDERVQRLHTEDIPNVNGNYSLGSCSKEAAVEDGLYANVVPNVYTESLPKSNSMDHSQPASENFKKYSISEEPPTDRCIYGVAKNDAVGDCTVANGGSDSNIVDSNEVQTFREWHEVVEAPSYGGEIFKILPYVIID